MTANQVTLARIALLPIPCAMLLFGNVHWHWLSFVLLVLLGMTDFVDGMMARREGPTKLGGLLDPVADKIMMAAITFALAGNGWVPHWIPVAILSREFLVTVLRSSVALKGGEVHTSVLAKLKTIIQMGGFGTVFLTVFLEPRTAQIVALAWAAFFFIIGGYYGAVKRRNAPYWAWPVGACFVYWFCLLEVFEQQGVILSLCLVIVGITWWSALDYLKTSYAFFKSSGMARFEWVRIFWVLSHSVFAVFVASFNPALIIPVLLSNAFELAVGGIDNIAISENKIIDEKVFLMSGFLACLLAMFQTQGLAILLLGASMVACAKASREVTWRFFPAP